MFVNFIINTIVPSVVATIYNKNSNSFQSTDYSTPYTQQKCENYTSDIDWENKPLVSVVVFSYLVGKIKKRRFEKRLYSFTESTNEQMLVSYDERTGFTYNISVNSSEIYHLFIYNSRFMSGIMSCGINCTLDSPLSVIHIEEIGISVNTSTNKYLKTLLRCNEKPKPFNPFRFSEQKKFTSILNLGNEYFVQNGRHFWRLSGFQYPKGIPQELKTFALILISVHFY